MVGGGVDEDAALVPGAALHTDVLMDVAQALQLPVADHDGCGEEKDKCQEPQGKRMNFKDRAHWSRSFLTTIGRTFE